jgi:hypothetical protein
MDDLSGENKTVEVLNLKDIASWQNVTEGRKDIPVIARVPSLQRGAVWKPAQDELLWDSILCGFPIGSFVVCKKINKDTQASRTGKYEQNNEKHENDFTHHLLDGQQRANAIALGFCDPMGDKEPESVLWLDLDPKDKILKTTRSFLFRITTKAHPWGYTKNDEAGRLSASQIRKALEAYGWRKNEVTIERKDWKLTDSWPWDANIPIPFAWLIKDTKESELNNPEAFWERIRNRCDNHFPKACWANNAVEFFKKITENSDKCRNIFSGLRHALKLQVVILQVPEESLMSDIPNLKTNDNIAHIEHLFQRLNAGGTPLEGEELTYSMIKAYWPGVEKTIDKLAQRIPASRLTMLSARTALANTDEKTLPGPITVSTLRRIVHESSQEGKSIKIKSFILPEKGQYGLQDVLKIISSWLEIDKTLVEKISVDIGLPAVLHTSIARGSPDLYLLLMILAKHALGKIGNCEDVINQTAYLRERLLGLSTALHWFGADKKRSVDAIYKKLDFNKPFPDDDFYKGLLKNIYKLEDGRVGVNTIPSPTELNSLIITPNDEGSLKKWAWWQQAQEKPEWAALQWMIKDGKELLLYAQRAYLMEKFPDYDPARQDLWQEHNRPWDFDHILASSKFYYKPNIFIGVKQWGYCIANLRAWPMEDNRSDQDDPPLTNKGKLNSQNVLDHSFIRIEEAKGFQSGFESITTPDNAIAFISSAKNRLLRIYRAWYDTLGIGFLTGP